MSHDQGRRPATAEDLAHAFEEAPQPIDLSHHGWEDWLSLAVFWAMVGFVFLQFFTRYVLNDSLAWTEEIAINALVVLVFVGSAMCVRTTRHIHVDVLYHYLPAAPARILSVAVDLIRVGFFAYGTWLMARYVALVAEERMTTVDLPRRWFFYLVLLGFALMLLRALQVLVGNWRRGYSVLERPGDFETPGA